MLNTVVSHTKTAVEIVAREESKAIVNGPLCAPLKSTVSTPSFKTVVSVLSFVLLLLLLLLWRVLRVRVYGCPNTALSLATYPHIHSNL